MKKRINYPSNGTWQDRHVYLCNCSSNFCPVLILSTFNDGEITSFGVMYTKDTLFRKLKKVFSYLFGNHDLYICDMVLDKKDVQELAKAFNSIKFTKKK